MVAPRLSTSSVVYLSREPGSLAPIARLIRRICVLREQGETQAARQMEDTQLAEAVRSFRAEQGREALTDADLGRIFETESERAAEAVLLAEILIPQLTSRRSAPSPARPSPPTVLPFVKPAERTGGPTIPDLLDSMLANEGATRRHRR